MLWHTSQLSAAMAATVIVASASGQCVPAESCKLTASDGAERDHFGHTISMSGDAILVGAHAHDGQATNSGAAYVYERAGGVWTETAALTAPDGEAYEYFGYSVSLSGDTAVVGAWWDDDLGPQSGSAYVFERIAGAWTFVAKLTASDGVTGDGFGGSVAVSGQCALVGAHGDDDRGTDSGSVYVFEKTGDGWAEVAKLTASDGAADDQFGGVAISGDTALVGSRLDDDHGEASGSAYVFEKIGGAWMEVAKLSAPDGEAYDYFGASRVIQGDSALVGARGDDDRGTGSGAVYVFEKIGGLWTPAAKLTASDGAAQDEFGSAVSFDGATALIGAWYDDDRDTDSGSAYVFEKVAGLWTERAKLTASDGATKEYFGASVSVSGDTAALGATYDDELAIEAGSAYVFDLCPSCPADFNGDGAVNTLDVLAFLNAWTAQDPRADFNGDGAINTLDVLAFLNAWTTGC